jgi:hypothetical protein
MSDIAHRHVTRGSECVCGSDWNWIADTCESIIPTPVIVLPVEVEEDWDSSFFECRKGHAFCGRH